MLVMLVSFVRQIENGTHIYSSLKHEDMMVCHSGKKNPISCNYKQVTPTLNVDIAPLKHMLPLLYTKIAMRISEHFYDCHVMDSAVHTNTCADE